MTRPWFTALAPATEDAFLTASVLPHRATEVATTLGQGPAGWAVELGARMAASITSAVPELGSDAVAAEVHKGCEAVALGALTALALDDDVTFAVMPEVLSGPPEVVVRGIGIEHMLRSIHVAHGTATRVLLDAAEQMVPEPQRFVEMRRINQVLFGIVDLLTDRMAGEYARAHEAWLTSSAALRMEIVEDLLNGTAVPPERATRILGYDLERWHLAVVAWSGPATAAGPRDLRMAAEQCLSTAGCTATLVLPVGAHQVWAWGSRTAHPPQPDTSTSSSPIGVRTAVGLAHRGVEGFRRSHQQAQEAARVGRMSARGGEAFRYSDVDIVAMLTADLPTAREFVSRELGELAGAGASVATMRHTLTCYLNRDRSLAGTAAELHVARNTVAYRVQRAEQLRGRPVSERRVQLHAALLIVEEFGDTILDDRHTTAMD